MKKFMRSALLGLMVLGSLVSAVFAAAPQEIPAVYMTKSITPEGMVRAYKALNWTPTGRVAVKLSTGEPPASNYLRAELIADVVRLAGGTIVECNTAYNGSRAESAMHYQVAKDHGFTAIAPFAILDEKGDASLPAAGVHLKENLVGKAFTDFDSYLVLTHFKGHAMAGFGGAIKNISIGLASRTGKCLLHSAGKSRTDPWGGVQDHFLESMGEGASLVNRIESRHGLHTLENAEKIGLGRRKYRLVSLD
ncbi:DUF362 domain-containing protein [Pyramidobacter porci]